MCNHVYKYIYLRGNTPEAGIECFQAVEPENAIGRNFTICASSRKNFSLSLSDIQGLTKKGLGSQTMGHGNRVKVQGINSIKKKKKRFLVFLFSERFIID